MAFTIRPATLEDAPSIASVHVESWKTTYEGIVPNAHLSSLKLEERTDMWSAALSAGKALIYVATDTSGVGGFACGGAVREAVNGYDGELYAIYLLQAWQRRGAGRALVRAVAEALVANGHKSMVVWVLRENPAVRFYQRLGGIEIAQKSIEIGGAVLEDVCFGWRSLEPLTDHGSAEQIFT
jgi:L-amino acid N-acyltransferase YncA